MKPDVPEVFMPDYLTEANTQGLEEVSPFEVLNKAAVQMGQRTEGLVQAEVYLAPFLGTIRYTFYLVIPVLNGYTDPLFYVWTTQPDRGYPVHLLESGASQEDQRLFENADDFATQLGHLFKSSWVRSRIRQWIEMAEERKPALKTG